MSLEDVIIKVTKDGEQQELFKANYPNLRTLRGFLDGEWNLSAYDTCFKGRSRLGDVDASTELNGHTLHIEFKASTWSMNKGQVLKAIRQAKYSNIVTFFVFGKRNQPVGYLQIAPSASHEDGFTNSGYVEVDEQDLHAHIKAWALQTEENVLVESKTAEWDKVQEVMLSLRNK